MELILTVLVQGAVWLRAGGLQVGVGGGGGGGGGPLLPLLPPVDGDGDENGALQNKICLTILTVPERLQAIRRNRRRTCRPWHPRCGRPTGRGGTWSWWWWWTPPPPRGCGRPRPPRNGGISQTRGLEETNRSVCIASNSYVGGCLLVRIPEAVVAAAAAVAAVVGCCWRWFGGGLLLVLLLVRNSRCNSFPKGHAH